MNVWMSCWLKSSKLDLISDRVGTSHSATLNASPRVIRSFPAHDGYTDFHATRIVNSTAVNAMCGTLYVWRFCVVGQKQRTAGHGEYPSRDTAGLCAAFRGERARELHRNAAAAAASKALARG